MAEIKLTRGHKAIIDDEDLERVSFCSWQSDGRYAKTRKWNKELQKYQTFYLHRFIIGAEGKEKEVDHINGDKFDNRKANLRYCTRAENIANKIREQKSGLRGVFRSEGDLRWFAYITVRGRLIRIGTWDSPEEAFEVRKAVEKIFYPHTRFTHKDVL